MEPLYRPNDEGQLRSENAYWRNVADYDKSVLPLYYYLKGVDWQIVFELHFASWQRDAVNKIETRVWDFGGYPWVGWYRDKTHPHGRKIQRYSIQHRFELARFARLVLPIPTPLEYAKRKLKQILEILTRQEAKSYERGLTAAPDKRLYRTNELKRISQVLGKTGLAGWEANSWLKTLLELNVSRRQVLDPAKAGAMLAKIDFFRLRWQDFHEAEQSDTPAPPKKSTPAAPAPNLAVAPVVTTLANLCRPPFTPADLNRLLTNLDVLTETLTPAGPTYRLSGSTGGKGGVRISKTFAALTELHENGLLNLVGWQAVMKAPPYGLIFGEKVRTYEYKSKNTRRQSDTFDAAIEQTQRWLNRWRTAYNSQKQP